MHLLSLLKIYVRVTYTEHNIIKSINYNMVIIIIIIYKMSNKKEGKTIMSFLLMN